MKEEFLFTEQWASFSKTLAEMQKPSNTTNLAIKRKMGDSYGLAGSFINLGGIYQQQKIIPNQATIKELLKHFGEIETRTISPTR